MVMRVSALRGSVPQQWLADFQAAMEGFGVVALTQRAQLADIYAELEGSSKCAGRSGSLAGWPQSGSIPGGICLCMRREKMVLSCCSSGLSAVAGLPRAGLPLRTR